ncbi:hypothetical protein ACP5Z9_005609, partial [Klebsiella pneumoniae]
NSLTKEERAAIRQQLAKMPGRFGDRRCRLTVIGESGEIDDFALALRQCLLTEEEILWWQQGGDFPRSLAHESGPAGLTGYFAAAVNVML